MRVRVLLVTIALALSATLLASGSAHAKQKLAVLGLEPIDDGDPKSQEKTAGIAKQLTDAMRARARGNPTYELAANSAKELTELKLLSDCLDENAECMSAIGKDLSADALIYGQVKKSRTAYMVEVRMLTVGAKSSGRPRSRTIPFSEANDESFRRAASALFSELTGAPLETSLVVSANVAVGTVYLDNVPRASLVDGKATIKDPPTGKVSLVIESKGYGRSVQDVDVEAGENNAVSVTLEAAIGPDIPGGGGGGGGGGDEAKPGSTARVLFWTSLVTTVGGAAAWTVTGLSVLDAESEARDRAAVLRTERNDLPADWDTSYCNSAGTIDPDELGKACDRGDSMELYTNIFIGVTAVAALSTAYFYYKGFVEPKKGATERTTSRKKKQSPTIVFTPTLGPTQAGLGAVIQF